MTPSRFSPQTIRESEDWTAVRKVLTEAHNAIRKAREDAIPRRWHEKDEAWAVSGIATLVGFVVFLSRPQCVVSVPMVLIALVVGPILTYAFAQNALLWEQKRDQTRDLPFTDAELQTIASLPLSPQTPGYKAWKAAAADHPLGLSDLENLIRAIDDHQDAEHKRHVLQHQNQIIFHEEGISSTTPP